MVKNIISNFIPLNRKGVNSKKNWKYTGYVKDNKNPKILDKVKSLQNEPISIIESN